MLDLGLRAGLEGPKGVSRALDLLVALLDGGRRHRGPSFRDHAHSDADGQAAGGRRERAMMAVSHGAVPSSEVSSSEAPVSCR